MFRVSIEGLLVFLAPVIVPAILITLDYRYVAEAQNRPHSHGFIFSIPWLLDRHFLRWMALTTISLGFAIGLFAHSKMMTLALAALILPTLASVLSCVEMTYYPGTHNLIPFEIAIYYLGGLFTIACLAMGTGLKWVMSPAPIPAHTCANCRNSLVGNQSGTCPECGTACPDSDETIDSRRTGSAIFSQDDVSES